MLGSSVENLLGSRHGSLFAFWTRGGPVPSASVQDHCDMVYALALAGRDHLIAQSATQRFISLLRECKLPGWSGHGEGVALSVHNCAYAFGAVNIAAQDRAAAYEAVLAHRRFLVDELIDPASGIPLYPVLWTHHTWRVSHWLGGVLSILLSLSTSGLADQKRFGALLMRTRAAMDGLLDVRSGLLAAYRNKALQVAFRCLYRFRHDPALGDLGGTAHILWHDHATGRDYAAVPTLLALARQQFYSRRPFMEASPYCLDFDVVQIVRTGLEQTNADGCHAAARAREMMAAIETFFAGPIPDRYALHKIPGALAAYHECAHLSGHDASGQIGRPAFDIIKRAHWL